MKKIFSILYCLCVFALIACDKNGNDPIVINEEGTYSLTIAAPSFGTPSGPQVSPRLISGAYQTPTGVWPYFLFSWEKGDVITIRPFDNNNNPTGEDIEYNVTAKTSGNITITTELPQGTTKVQVKCGVNVNDIIPIEQNYVQNGIYPSTLNFESDTCALSEDPIELSSKWPVLLIKPEYAFTVFERTPERVTYNVGLSTITVVQYFSASEQYTFTYKKKNGKDITSTVGGGNLTTVFPIAVYPATKQKPCSLAVTINYNHSDFTGTEYDIDEEEYPIVPTTQVQPLYKHTNGVNVVMIPDTAYIFEPTLNLIWDTPPAQE